MGKSATLFVTALCSFVALTVTPQAQAQQWLENLPPQLLNGQPTIFQSGGPAPVIAEGRIKMGGVIAAFPVQYSHVGRLRNDVYRTTSLTKSRSLGLAAGTPMFRAQLTFDALDINIRAAGPVYWCGVPTHEKNPQPLCWEEEKMAYGGVGKVYLGHPMSTSPSPYFPRGRGLKDAQASDFPLIVSDETARAELPTLELVYVLTQADRCSAFVQAGMRAGDKVHVLWTLDYGCSRGSGKGDRNRSMVFSAGDGLVCAYSVGDDGADISVMRQPTKYMHPWEHDVLADWYAENRAMGLPAIRQDARRSCPPKASK